MNNLKHWAAILKENVMYDWKEMEKELKQYSLYIPQENPYFKTRPAISTFAESTKLKSNFRNKKKQAPSKA